MVGDVLRDAHMQSRCVTQLTIVTFRPQVRIAGSMDELDSDPSPLAGDHDRSEEHTSELQSRRNLVCRLLLEKKKSELPEDRDCRAFFAPTFPAHRSNAWRFLDRRRSRRSPDAASFPESLRPSRPET